MQIIYFQHIHSFSWCASSLSIGAVNSQAFVYVYNAVFNITQRCISVLSLKNCLALSITYEFPLNENYSLFYFPTSVIITTVLYLSDALRKNFLNENFDYKVE